MGTAIGLILQLKSVTISTSISWGPAGPVTALTQTQNIYLAIYGALFDSSELNVMQVAGIIVGITGSVVICVEKIQKAIMKVMKRMGIIN
jgi:drug/metabolite transporter (DMT)-like permease